MEMSTFHVIVTPVNHRTVRTNLGAPKRSHESFKPVDRSPADSATRYLVSLGHREIGIITGDPTSGTSVDRLERFMGALRSAKIRPNRSMIHRGHNDMESGHFHAMQLLTRSDRPTAIFCTNNMMALGALAAIQEIGLACPEDISLLGFDDFYWATLLRPRLTVVR